MHAGLQSNIGLGMHNARLNLNEVPEYLYGGTPGSRSRGSARRIVSFGERCRNLGDRIAGSGGALLRGCERVWCYLYFYFACFFLTRAGFDAPDESLDSTSLLLQ